MTDSNLSFRKRSVENLPSQGYVRAFPQSWEGRPTIQSETTDLNTSIRSVHTTWSIEERTIATPRTMIRDQLFREKTPVKVFDASNQRLEVANQYMWMKDNPRTLYIGDPSFFFHSFTAVHCNTGNKFLFPVSAMETL